MEYKPIMAQITLIEKAPILFDKAIGRISFNMTSRLKKAKPYKASIDFDSGRAFTVSKNNVFFRLLPQRKIL